MIAARGSARSVPAWPGIVRAPLVRASTATDPQPPEGAILPTRLARLAAAATLLAACTDDPIRPEPQALDIVPLFQTGGAPAGAVTDLRVVSATRHAATLTWTQVDDGTGAPAQYRVKYAESPLVDWKNATLGCDAEPGDGGVGAEISCVVEGLEPLTAYDFQLMSHRVQEAAWTGAVYSNVASATTEALDASGAVDDLQISDITNATLTLRWTEVNDGTGAPARYQVRYAAPPIAWEDASIGCAETLPGSEIGATTSCTIEGLQGASSYDVRVASYRLDADGPTEVRYSNVASATTAVRPTVRDLRPVRVTPSTLRVEWTQIDDGTGEPAWYRVKYAESPLLDWKVATVGCERTLRGDGIGAPMSCTIEGLSPDIKYDVQLMSYRMVEGVWDAAEYSNLVTAWTGGSATRGIWVDAAAIAAAPRTGPVWEALTGVADVPCGSVDLSDPERYTHLCVLTKALLFAATGDGRRLDEVLAYLADFSDDAYSGSAWVLGREIPAYVIAADLIGLPVLDPTLDEAIRAQLTSLLDTPTDSGPPNLVTCHEERPNNWGTHCGAARVAIAAYLGDESELDRVATIFRGWLGDRAAYVGFAYGGPEEDLSWQCDAGAPVGINPDGCTKDGHPIGGVLPDDQRRSGPFTWPPPRENYVWEALQGAVAQAVMLHRAGYTPFEWGDRALLRAVDWLYHHAGYPAEGDDQWVPHVINYFYGTAYPAPVPANPGKIVAWGDWIYK